MYILIFFFSTGILLWEIYSFGGMPYQGMKNPDVAKFVGEEGKRLEKPNKAPQPIYDIMMNCWEEVSMCKIFLSRIWIHFLLFTNVQLLLNMDLLTFP